MSCFNTKHLHYYGSTFKLQNSLVKPVYQKISLVGFLLFTNVLVISHKTIKIGSVVSIESGVLFNFIKRRAVFCSHHKTVWI